MSKLETITIDTPSGSNTMQIGSTNTATINLGASGDTINIPAGATIANAGTATGFSSTISTPYAARMWSDSVLTVTNDAYTTLDFSAEVFDKGSIADTSTNRITVPSGAGGFWWFTGAVQVMNFRAARNILTIFLNGNNTGGLNSGNNFELGKPDASGTYQTVQLNQLMNLSAADYVELKFYHNEGSNQSVVNRALTAWYLGSAT